MFRQSLTFKETRLKSRREFMRQTALLGIGGATTGFASAFAGDAKTADMARSSTAPMRAAARKLRVLILGGTGNIGPQFVHAAIARGHKVSVFSRGQNQKDLPAQVERLTGDRNTDLASISNRDWDAVFDLATYGPLWIQKLGEALKGRVRHYTYISSQDAYKDASSNDAPTNEQSVIWSYEGDIDPYSQEATKSLGKYTKPFCESSTRNACMPKAVKQYGSLKVLCEQEAEKQFPGRVVVLRPGYLVGPGDAQWRFTYWVMRLQKGGDVLAPGNPLQTVQFIDLRDIAEWAVRMAEQGEAGIYNTNGPDKAMSMCEMLGGIRGAFSSSVKLTWVTEPTIFEPRIFDGSVPYWGGSEIFGRDIQIDSSKAYAKGLVCRPLSATALDVFKWYTSLSEEEQSGISSLRGTTIKWEDIFAKEKKIIEAWKVHLNRIT